MKGVLFQLSFPERQDQTVKTLMVKLLWRSCFSCGKICWMYWTEWTRWGWRHVRTIWRRRLGDSKVKNSGAVVQDLALKPPPMWSSPTGSGVRPTSATRKENCCQGKNRADSEVEDDEDVPTYLKSGMRRRHRLPLMTHRTMSWREDLKGLRSSAGHQKLSDMRKLKTVLLHCPALMQGLRYDRHIITSAFACMEEELKELFLHWTL